MVGKDEEAALWRETAEEPEDAVDFVADDLEPSDALDIAEEPDLLDVLEVFDGLFAPILPKSVIMITDNIIEITDAPNNDKANLIVVFLSIFHLIYKNKII